MTVQEAVHLLLMALSYIVSSHTSYSMVQFFVRYVSPALLTVGDSLQIFLLFRESIATRQLVSVLDLLKGVFDLIRVFACVIELKVTSSSFGVDSRLSQLNFSVFNR